MNTNDGIARIDLVGIVRRRGPWAAATAGLVFLAAIFIAAILPNRYEAWCTLLISPQTVSKKLVEPGVAESDLNNRLHLMTMQILSRGRLSRVIDDLGLYQKESREFTREEVIDLMRRDVRVEPVFPEMEDPRRRGNQDFEINTFRLYYRSHSPQKAADVANRLATDFIDEHIKERVATSTATSEFIEAELSRLASQIQEVEQRIGAVKNENSGSLPESLDANERLLERAISDLRLAQRDLAMAESDEAFYRQQALTGASDRWKSGAEPDTPRQRKQRLEISLGEMRSRGFTDKHPDVIALREEIAMLDDAAGEGEDEQALSGEQQLARNEEKRAALRAASARAEVERLMSQADEVQARIAKTPQVAEILAALEREHQHLYSSYQEFSGKKLEAGVAANMERRQKGEQFSVLEAAFPPPTVASPNRLAILMLGLFLGAAAGAGVAMLLEFSDSSLHTPLDLQEALRLPVLAAIPKVMLESDRLRMVRRRMTASLLAMGISGMILLGAGAGYVVVNGMPSFASALFGDATSGPSEAEPGRG